MNRMENVKGYKKWFATEGVAEQQNMNVSKYICSF